LLLWGAERRARLSEEAKNSSFSLSHTFTTGLFVQKLTVFFPFVWCIHTVCTRRKY